MTNAAEWDPSVLDHSIKDDDRWYDVISDNNTEHSMWDEFGRYKERVAVSHSECMYRDLHDAVDDSVIYHTYKTRILTSKYGETIIMNNDIKNPVMIKEQEPDYDTFWPLFAWLPTDTIKRTWKLTTQYARIPISTILKKHYKASHPALNVTRRNEDIATDTVYSNTPAVDCEVKIA